jgi:hypothetical protein
VNPEEVFTDFAAKNHREKTVRKEDHRLKPVPLGKVPSFGRAEKFWIGSHGDYDKLIKSI